MNSLQKYINRVISDRRLNLFHVSLSLALCDGWISNDFSSFQVSRRRLMKAARIRSKTTYHKTIQDLQRLGYIDYKPSYHPLLGSTILIKQPV